MHEVSVFTALAAHRVRWPGRGLDSETEFEEASVHECTVFPVRRGADLETELLEVAMHEGIVFSIGTAASMRPWTVSVEDRVEKVECMKALSSLPALPPQCMKVLSYLSGGTPISRQS